MYSYRIEQAIRAACILHEKQHRKGDLAFPYVTHLFSVAFMLQDYTDNEDAVIAALLHDTVEDTDYTLAELRQDFGDTVHDIVAALTEPYTDGDRPLTWLERKSRYANQLQNGPMEAVMVAAADKAHNFRTTIEEYYDDHNRFFQDFGRKLDDRERAYNEIAAVIQSRLEGPLLTEFNYVFEEYTSFIHALKAATEPAPLT